MTKNGKIPRHYIPYDPNQSFLLPPDMSCWLPANHMVYFLINLLQETDLSAFDRSATSHRGRPRYHYQMLCGLLLYAYSQGVTSSRLIERKTTEEIPYRILAGNSHPDHNTIANFRKQYLPELSSVSTALLLKLQQARYLSLNLVSVDGTKLKANASIHQNITRENAWKRKKEIEQWIHQKLQEADRQDQEEDDRFDDQNPFLGIPSGSYANKTIEELTQEVNRWDHFLDQSKREYAKKGKWEQKRQEQEKREREKQQQQKQEDPAQQPDQEHSQCQEKDNNQEQAGQTQPEKVSEAGLITETPTHSMNPTNRKSRNGSPKQR